MSSRSLIGVDLGTHSAKGVAYAPDGRLRAAHEIRYEHGVPARGRAEMDAERWWDATRVIVRTLLDAAGPAQAVGITGQAPTLLAVDADGRPLRPAILWLDVRSDAEAAALAGTLGPDAERVGGNRLHAYYLGPKLAWLRAHEPGIFERTATVLQSHSLPVLRLTGERVTDFASAALCAPLWDARARTWSARMCAGLGVPRARLAEARPAHAIAGEVTAAAAAATGLDAGVPVVVGGADFAASALAAGVTEPGEACLMLGTSGNLMMPLAAPQFDTRLINAHHVGCDRWLALGATLAGAVQEWFRGLVGRDVGFDVLDAEAARTPAGADGLVLLPYLQGERTPLWDAGARGAFAGLTLSHGRGHLYRAVLEGVAVSFRHCAEVLRERGTAVREVVAVNGGARSPLWRQILADALGAPLAWVRDSSGAPAGAALLAGIGAGVLPGVEAARRWRGDTVRHAPEAAATARYAALLEQRLELHRRLREVA